MTIRNVLEGWTTKESKHAVGMKTATTFLRSLPELEPSLARDSGMLKQRSCNIDCLSQRGDWILRGKSSPNSNCPSLVNCIAEGSRLQFYRTLKPGQWRRKLALLKRYGMAEAVASVVVTEWQKKRWHVVVVLQHCSRYVDAYGKGIGRACESVQL